MNNTPPPSEHNTIITDMGTIITDPIQLDIQHTIGDTALAAIPPIAAIPVTAGAGITGNSKKQQETAAAGNSKKQQETVAAGNSKKQQETVAAGNSKKQQETVAAVIPVTTTTTIQDNTIIELPTTSTKKLRTQLETKMELINSEIFTIDDVHNILKQTRNYSESHYSTICDLVATYLKGQKILYIESKSICEQRLNILMLPTILITALCSILSLLLKDGTEGPIIVSSLNGFNVFVLAVINYLKLDARAEAHRMSAYKFDKMESELIFNSGKMLFIEGATNDIPNIIIDTEKNVKEVKETNQFILPEKIRFGFPITCNTNVFAEVKHIQNKEATLISTFKDILNEIVKIQTDIANSNSKTIIELEIKLDILKKEKKEVFDKIIHIRDEYLKIDDMFESEIAEYQKRTHCRCSILNCLKN